MSQCLLVTGSHIIVESLGALATITLDIGLAHGAHDGSHGQVSVKRKETLEVHVQILANSLGVTIPTANSVGQFEGYRIDGGRGSNRRATVET